MFQFGQLSRQLMSNHYNKGVMSRTHMIIPVEEEDEGERYV